jgi:hypothetical protein
MSFLSFLHDLLNVLREELWFDSVDDVEEELSVDVLHCTIILNDVWKVLLDIWVVISITSQHIGTQLCNLRHDHYLHLVVAQILDQTEIKLILLSWCCS